MDRLRAENQELREELSQVKEALRQALARIEELEKQREPPEFVKENVKKRPAEEKKPRKKREAKHNRGRARSVPTQIVEHRLLTCPQCHLRLGGISLARVREVIELAEPQPVEVIHHRIFKGCCTQCQRWHEAPVDLHEQVLGQGRIGVRLTSLIALLRTVTRLPVRQIRSLLLLLYGCEISIGEIVELLHRVVTQAKPVLEEIKAQIRASPAVQADETGWREDGENGYIWSASTPTLRYYEYHHSRSGEVVKELIGPDFAGVLGSDFYAGYNSHQGLHQRCWVHYLRDIHNLKKKYPQDEGLLLWAQQVKQVYDDAVTWAEQGPDPHLSARQQQQAGVAQQHAFEQRLWALCQPFAHTLAFQHTLCERMERFLPEMFAFLAFPGVPAHNNLAERSVRPLVIARKISGGSRSPKGSATRMGLASLFGTWMAQGLNPFSQCVAFLTQANPFGQV
ncbi:MAG TPA: IS66 family transposase [Ktedonobacteraceae bacterium]|nr:IS66 family transposase [Ktedonobacteraceae bacterium]